MNALIIRALLSFYLYYGDDFTIECPTGSGRLMNLFEVAGEIANRLTRIFLQDERGRRPVYGGTGLVGGLIHIFGLLDPKRFLEEGRKAAFDRGEVKT